MAPQFEKVQGLHLCILDSTIDFAEARNYIINDAIIVGRCEPEKKMKFHLFKQPPQPQLSSAQRGPSLFVIFIHVVHQCDFLTGSNVEVSISILI